MPNQIRITDKHSTYFNSVFDITRQCSSYAITTNRLIFYQNEFEIVHNPEEWKVMEENLKKPLPKRKKFLGIF